MRRVILILCGVTGKAVTATPSSACARSAPPPGTQVPLSPSGGPKVTPPGSTVTVFQREEPALVGAG